MAIEEKLSALVRNQFPSFYQEEGENFILFMKAYYEYMEQSGKAQHELKKIESYKDIDETITEYIEYFRRTVMAEIPETILADRRLLAKRIRDLYQTKGSFTSYKLLFRILYNEDVEINYPADQILKVSDGDWRIDQYLVTNHDKVNVTFIGKTITGVESFAEALVENVVKRSVRGRVIDQLYLSNVKGTFSDQEPIRIKGTVSPNPHTPIVEAGISNFTIVSAGAKYQPGDIVNILSDVNGLYGKVVVVKTVDLGGAITFSILDGGSGYSSSVNDTTEIDFIGGDGDSPASFTIRRADIVDTFDLSLNINFLISNTVFGSNAASIVNYPDGIPRKMTTFANVVIGAPSFGFPEQDEIVTDGIPYRTNANAAILVANAGSDPGLTVGKSFYGESSGSNGEVVSVLRVFSGGNVLLKVNTYGNFTAGSPGEKIRIDTASGTTVGTVSEYYANTIGGQVLNIANLHGVTITEGTEILGRTSGSYGVIKTILSITPNGDTRLPGSADDRDVVKVWVAANTTANVSNQFHAGAGPMKYWELDEGIRLVSSNTTIGNVVINSTRNRPVENIHTRLEDAFVFQISQIGTIAELSNRIGGSGFSIAPTIRVVDTSVSALGIGESYMTLHYNDENFGTSNPSITTIDTNDRIGQSNTGGPYAIGDVKRRVSSQQYANGTYEIVVRVWQDPLQRDPGAINYSNNQFVDVYFYTDASQTSQQAGSPGIAKIVNYQDEGVLGKNANISSSVGANGTISSLRLVDSGFNYLDGELVRIQETSRPDAQQATATLTLSGTANIEGYYATTRSHVSSLRGYLHDNNYYQEFSYEVQSAISLSRYRDIALRLVHPSGEKFFGRFKTASNVDVNIAVSDVSRKRQKSAGTITIARTSANSGTIAIENNKYKMTATNVALSKNFGNFKQFTDTGNGSVTATSTNSTIIGVGTTFTNFAVGDTLNVGGNRYKITTIANNTVMSFKPQPGSPGPVVTLGPSASSNSNYYVNREVRAWVEVDPGADTDNIFVPIRFTANTATNAILEEQWIYGTQTVANIYYYTNHTITGSGTALSTDFEDGDVIVFATGNNTPFYKATLNKVSSATSANLESVWFGPNISGANVYYYTGSLN